MRWLNAREWLEYERLTGLPTADLAGEALGMLDVAEGGEEWTQAVLDALQGPEKPIEAINELTAFYDAVLEVLTDAGVVDDDVTADQVGGLLRMFLPAEAPRASDEL